MQKTQCAKLLNSRSFIAAIALLHLPPTFIKFGTLSHSLCDAKALSQALSFQPERNVELRLSSPERPTAVPCNPSTTWWPVRMHPMHPMHPIVLSHR